jgi:peroxiredoxin
MRRVIVWLVLLLTGMLQPMAQERTRERVDVSKLGPQVGERVPDFTLVDQTGRTRNAQSIMGSRGAMLVFVRSADW